MLGAIGLLFCVPWLGLAQSIAVLPAPTVTMPAKIVDGNSPGVWIDGDLKIFTSTGNPLAMKGQGLFNLSMDLSPFVNPNRHYPIWIEAVWRDDDGTLYGWYHHEPGGICGGKLSAPKIGAVVSTDNGETFHDLGIVLESGDPINCAAQNGFFAGGHGDFSVILDRNREYFYFLFTNYGGDPETQGISMARMAFDSRHEPVGAVYKLSREGWTEPGLGGAVAPILPATVPWERSNADSFWGPAIHWNSEIERYIVVMNRACCDRNWPQEGIYAMFGEELANPGTWTAPTRILAASQIGFAPGYYPQVFGVAPGETDSLASQLPRLFIKGTSKWQLYVTR